MSMSRRSMFGFGAAAGAAVGVGGIGLLNSETKENLPIPEELTNTLTLNQKYNNGKPEKIGIGEHIMYLGDTSVAPRAGWEPQEIKNASLSLTVGADGHMYVRINDKWKRVVTEA